MMAHVKPILSVSRKSKLNGESIMKLLPLVDRTSNVKYWADPRSSWMTDLDGNAVALIAVDGRVGCAGNIVHVDEAGTVLPGLCSFALGNGNAPLPRGLLRIH